MIVQNMKLPLDLLAPRLPHICSPSSRRISKQPGTSSRRISKQPLHQKLRFPTQQDLYIVFLLHNRPFVSMPHLQHSWGAADAGPRGS